MGSPDKVRDEIIEDVGTSRSSKYLINILKEKGEKEKVIKACLKALEIFPDDISIRKTLAETYLEQGSGLLAEMEIDKISRQIKELSYIFKLQAELFQKEGRVKEAADSLNKYLTHYSEDKEAVQLLSGLDRRTEEDQEVITTPTLAEIYFKQGETDEAIKIYQKVIQASPDDEKSKKRLSEIEQIKKTGTKKGPAKDARSQKLKLIGILERWLADIEQRRNAFAASTV